MVVHKAENNMSTNPRDSRQCFSKQLTALLDRFSLSQLFTVCSNLGAQHEERSTMSQH